MHTLCKIVVYMYMFGLSVYALRCINAYMRECCWKRITENVMHETQAKRKQEEHERNRVKKRFVFCDGKKKNVLFIELVDPCVFEHYERYIGYGVIDMNNRSIYFDASN